MKIMGFKSCRDLRLWLSENHDQSDGIWLRIYKKDSGVATVAYSEALDQAICHGWIDGQRKPHDARSWLQKLTPRTAKSGWSKINTERVERLIKSGDMTPAGMKAVSAAKADGRWAAAYDSFSNATVPEDFLKALTKEPKAKSFFATLNKTNIYSITYRLQTAKKPETRERRMKLILAMLSQGKKFHP